AARWQAGRRIRSTSHAPQKRTRHARARPAHPCGPLNEPRGRMDCRVKPGNDEAEMRARIRHPHSAYLMRGSSAAYNRSTRKFVKTTMMAMNITRFCTIG